MSTGSSVSSATRAFGAFSLLALGLALALTAVLGLGRDGDSTAEGSRTVEVTAAVEDPVPTVIRGELADIDRPATGAVSLDFDTNDLTTSNTDSTTEQLAESEFQAFSAGAISQALDDEEGKVKLKIKWLDDQGIKVEVVTGLFVEEGDAVNNGDRVIEVSGRPIFVFEGRVPATRTLEFGDTGPDVVQLEQALVALGYGVGAHDGIYDGALVSGLSAFYADNGYSLPEPSASKLADVRNVESDLAELETDLAKLQLELSAESLIDSTDDGFQKREEARIKIEAHNARIGRLKARQAPFAAEQIRITNLIVAINGSYASGNFGFLNTDDLPLDLRTEFRRLTSDDTDEFLTIDALIDELNKELAAIRDDFLDIENDIEDERSDREVTESELDQLERERYHIDDSTKADEIRLDIEVVHIKTQQKLAELADAQQKLVPDFTVDEYVFIPGLPGKVDEVKVELRDPADDGTLLEIETGEKAEDADEDAETKVTADGEVAVDEDAEDEEESAEDEAAEDAGAEDSDAEDAPAEEDADAEAEESDG